MQQGSFYVLQVRLKDIVDYITGIIAQNAVSSSLLLCLPQMLASAAAEMESQSKAILQNAAAQSVQQDTASNSKGFLSDHTRMCISNLAEELLDLSVTQVQPWLHTSKESL